jgi:hypothetical protein
MVEKLIHRSRKLQLQPRGQLPLCRKRRHPDGGKLVAEPTAMLSKGLGFL